MPYILRNKASNKVLMHPDGRVWTLEHHCDAMQALQDITGYLQDIDPDSDASELIEVIDLSGGLAAVTVATRQVSDPLSDHDL